LLEVDHSRPGTFESKARRLQQQLWRDLDHLEFNGVRVLREMARSRPGDLKAAMPIVFTSALAYDSSRAGAGLSRWLGRSVFDVSQTPQVWLDHVVLEDAGALSYSWDVVEELFPQGMIDDSMFYVSWFSEGIRVFDVSDAKHPAEVGFYEPPDPKVRIDARTWSGKPGDPNGSELSSLNHVFVDKRGLIYASGYNDGLWILEYTGPRPDLDELFDDPWEFKEGQITIPDRPGLGLTLNEQALKEALAG